MSQKFLTPIDLVQSELQNARIQNLSSAPGTPVAGQIYFDTTLHKLRWWNDNTTAWVNAEGTVGAVTAVSATAPIVSSGGTTPNLTLNALVNADISAGAAIVYSKLALTGAILNADLAGSIAYGKLTLTNSIVNADVAAAAAIAVSKLALGTADQVLVTDNPATTAKWLSGLTNVHIAAGAAIAYSKLNLTGAVLNADLAGSIAYSKLSLTGAILNADLAGSIAYSKLTLTNSIVNADIAAAAGIVYSKLNLTTSIVNGDIGAAAAIAYSKLALANSVVNADIAAGAAIAYSKLSLAGSVTNADLAGSIAYSKLTLSNSVVNADIAAGAAIAYSKLNLAGAILNADLAGSIAYSKLSAPVATVSMGSQIVQNVATPVSGTDAANKAYVDAATTGLDVKASVRALATTQTALTGTQTIDGVALIATDRILLTGQTAPAENGIWVVSAGAWARAADADASSEVTAGMYTFVEEGTVNADTGWILSTNNPITLGTTGLTFVQFSAAGQIGAGAGLTKTGNTLDVIGTTNRITVAADSVDISTAYVGQATITTLGTITTGVWNGTAIDVLRGGTGGTTVATAKTSLGFMSRYAVSFGDGAATSYVITHNLGTQDVIVDVFRATTPWDQIQCDVEATSTNTVTLRFAVAPTSNQYRVVIIG